MTRYPVSLRPRPPRIRSGAIAVALIAAMAVGGCYADRPPGWTFRPPSTAVAGATRTPIPTPAPTVVEPPPAGAPSASPSPSLGPAPPPATPVVTVPILYYHRIQPLPANYADFSPARRRTFTTYDVLPVAFAAQLDWLRDHGYTTILPRDLVDHWANAAALPAQPVIITFDDGSHDWVSRVGPMLKSRGMVAEFYLTLDAIRHGNLTWGEVRRLAAAGNGIGAHDVHHVQLTAFGNSRRPAPRDVMWAEINDARTIIGRHVGILPDSMSYVGGGFDKTLVRLVEQAGYTSARSIRRGIAQDPGHRFALRVIRIGVHDDVTDLVDPVLVPGLPTFTKRMAGVSDKAP